MLFSRFFICPRWVVGLVVLLGLLSPTHAHAKYAAVMVDADSGVVLHSANANTRNYPASLTKMMTIYMAFEAVRQGKLSMNQELKVSKRAQGMAPSKLWLQAGDTITLKNAIMAMITKSANDAAVVVAEAIGGTEVKFARMMTEKANELGMKRTVFRNATGLPHRGQLSTANDMALLARTLIKTYPAYYPWFSTYKFVWRGHTYYNHNKLLRSFDGMDGLKTGYTQASGFNLAASAEQNGQRVIAVVFGGKTSKWRNYHTANLMKQAFYSGKLRSAQLLPPPPKSEILHASLQKQAQKLAMILPNLSPSAGSMGLIKSANASEPGDWSVQVGAFAQEDRAKLAAEKALNVGGFATDLFEADVVELARGRKRLYGARLTGLNEEQARNACSTLRAKRWHDCLVYAPRRNMAGL